MNGVPDHMRRPDENSQHGRRRSSPEAENERSASEELAAVKSAPEPVVGVKAAARFLGVSPSLVYAYVERRQVPHYRLGRSISRDSTTEEPKYVNEQQSAPWAGQTKRERRERL